MTISAFAAAIALTGSPVRARAQIPVTDAGAIAQLIVQVARQVQAIVVAKNQLTAQLNNMQKLASPQWRSIASTQAQVDWLTQQGKALSYALPTIDTQFGATFSGWQTYPDLRTTTRLQNERTLATLRGVLNAANATAQQLGVSSSTLATIKSQVGSITSAQQASEVNGTIGVLTAEELTLLRQQLAMQANVQAVTLANQVNRDLQGAAATAAFEAAGAATPLPRPRRTASALGW